MPEVSLVAEGGIIQVQRQQQQQQQVDDEAGGRSTVTTHPREFLAAVNLHWTHEYRPLASVASAFSIAGLQFYSVNFVLYEFGSGLLIYL